MEVSKTAEVIARLKAVREAKGLSYAEIARRVSASGGYVAVGLTIYAFTIKGGAAEEDDEE